MNLSVTDPVSRAIERTRTILFSPFDLKKWFVLGFCVFLAELGEGGGSGNASGNWKGGRGPGGGTASIQTAIDWIQANLSWLVPTAAIALSVLVGLLALFTWLASRGKFMFLDGIARNRGAVVEPWRDYAQQGDSLFVVLFLLHLCGIVLLVSIAVVGGWMAWPSIRAEQFGSEALTAIIVCGSATLLVLVAMLILSVLLEDFVVPTMYLTGQPIFAAWSIAHEELIRGHVGTVVLFYLMKLVLGLAVGVIAVGATCLTCCLTAVPYLGTVILLPLYVFERCYVLSFLEQYGPSWVFFKPESWQPKCGRCGYDLRYNVSGVCPECGTPTNSTGAPAGPSDVEL